MQQQINTVWQANFNERPLGEVIDEKVDKLAPRDTLYSQGRVTPVLLDISANRLYIQEAIIEKGRKLTYIEVELEDALSMVGSSRIQYFLVRKDTSNVYHIDTTNYRLSVDTSNSQIEGNKIITSLEWDVGTEIGTYHLGFYSLSSGVIDISYEKTGSSIAVINNINSSPTAGSSFVPNRELTLNYRLFEMIDSQSGEAIIAKLGSNQSMTEYVDENFTDVDIRLNTLQDEIDTIEAVTDEKFFNKVAASQEVTAETIFNNGVFTDTISSKDNSSVLLEKTSEGLVLNDVGQQLIILSDEGKRLKVRGTVVTNDPNTGDPIITPVEHDVSYIDDIDNLSAFSIDYDDTNKISDVIVDNFSDQTIQGEKTFTDTVFLDTIETTDDAVIGNENYILNLKAIDRPVVIAPTTNITDTTNPKSVALVEDIVDLRKQVLSISNYYGTFYTFDDLEAKYAEKVPNENDYARVVEDVNYGMATTIYMWLENETTLVYEWTYTITEDEKSRNFIEQPIEKNEASTDFLTYSSLTDEAETRFSSNIIIGNTSTLSDPALKNSVSIGNNNTVTRNNEVSFGSDSNLRVLSNIDVPVNEHDAVNKIHGDSTYVPIYRTETLNSKYSFYSEPTSTYLLAGAPTFNSVNVTVAGDETITSVSFFLVPTEQSDITLEVIRNNVISDSHIVQTSYTGWYSVSGLSLKDATYQFHLKGSSACSVGGVDDTSNVLNLGIKKVTGKAAMISYEIQNKEEPFTSRRIPLTDDNPKTIFSEIIGLSSNTVPRTLKQEGFEGIAVVDNLVNQAPVIGDPDVTGNEIIFCKIPDDATQINTLRFFYSRRSTATSTESSVRFYTRNNTGNTFSEVVSMRTPFTIDSVINELSFKDFTVEVNKTISRNSGLYIGVGLPSRYFIGYATSSEKSFYYKYDSEFVEIPGNIDETYTVIFDEELDSMSGERIKISDSMENTSIKDYIDTVNNQATNGEFIPVMGGTTLVPQDGDLSKYYEVETGTDLVQLLTIDTSLITGTNKEMKIFVNLKENQQLTFAPDLHFVSNVKPAYTEWSVASTVYLEVIIYGGQKIVTQIQRFNRSI